MKLCIIDSDVDGVLRLTARLQEAYFLVDSAHSLQSGTDLLRLGSYDLLIVSCHLSDGRAWDLCMYVRNQTWTIPILVTTCERCSAKERIQALHAGADDCVSSRIHFDEMLARIRALLRRPRGLVADILTFNHLTLNTRDQSVFISKYPVHLTRKEYMILEYLLRRKDTIVSRMDLLEHVWESGTDQFSNTLETHISSLRRKFAKIRPGLRVIQTISGRGYRIARE